MGNGKGNRNGNGDGDGKVSVQPSAVAGKTQNPAAGSCQQHRHGNRFPNVCFPNRSCRRLPTNAAEPPPAPPPPPPPLRVLLTFTAPKTGDAAPGARLQPLWSTRTAVLPLRPTVGAAPKCQRSSPASRCLFQQQPGLELCCPLGSNPARKKTQKMYFGVCSISRFQTQPGLGWAGISLPGAGGRGAQRGRLGWGQGHPRSWTRCPRVPQRPEGSGHGGCSTGSLQKRLERPILMESKVFCVTPPSERSSPAGQGRFQTLLLLLAAARSTRSSFSLKV